MWYDQVDDNVATAAKELAGNWRSFESFGWSGRPECADDCAIVYLSSRDCSELERSNEAQILDALAEFIGEIDNGSQVETQSHNHWAVGHVDGIVIRCIDDAGEPTEAFKVLHGLALQLAEYPCLDESDWSDREYTAETEAWDNYGASDFRSELVRLAPHHADLFSHVSADHLSTVWGAICEENRGGERCTHESDGSVYFAFDSVFGKRAGACRLIWKDVRTVFLNEAPNYKTSRIRRNDHGSI